MLKRRKTDDLTNIVSTSEETDVTAFPEVSLPKTIDEISQDVVTLLNLFHQLK